MSRVERTKELLKKSKENRLRREKEAKERQEQLPSTPQSEAREAIDLMRKALGSGINYMDEGSAEQQANEALALMRLATLPKPKPKKKLPPFYVPPNEEGVKCWTLLNKKQQPYTTCIDKKTSQQLRKDYTSSDGRFKFV